MWKEKRPSSGCCGAAKAKLLPKKRPTRSHAQAMHSMPLDLSDQSQVLLTQSVSSLRQGKVTNQAWVVPVKSRGDKGQETSSTMVWRALSRTAPYDVDPELSQEQTLALLTTQVRQLS